MHAAEHRALRELVATAGQMARHWRALHGRGIGGGVLPAGADDAARMAPGPSSVLPCPSSVAPTRIAILPRCLFSCRSWWACATSSNGIVFHSTGRTCPVSIRCCACRHSQALAKCEPRISFWRIHR